MDLRNLWWECPKCRSKVAFGMDLSTLFCQEDDKAYFCPKNGVSFLYKVCCSNENCNATWDFGISDMYES